VINFYEQSINENVDFVGRFDLGPTKNTLLIYGGGNTGQVATCGTSAPIK